MAEQQQEQKSIPEVGSELLELVKGYAKQETVEPLRSLGRYVSFGTAGALVLGVGVVLLMLAGLRALQTETGSTFTGSLSWLPYAIVLAVALLLVAVAAARITRK